MALLSRRFYRSRMNDRKFKPQLIVDNSNAMCGMFGQVIFMLQFFSSIDDLSLSFTVAKMVANCLAYMNSCVNPILYAFLSDNFRKAFFRLVACCAGGGHGAGGFNALRKMELEQTNVTVGRRIEMPVAVAATSAKKTLLDGEEIEPTAGMTQQTNL